MSSNFVTHLKFLSSVSVLGFLALIIVALGVFGSGSSMLGVFYTLITIWSLLVSYRLIILGGASTVVDAAVPALPPVEQLDFLAAPKEVVDNGAPSTAATTYGTVPVNLPTASYAYGGEEVRSDELARELEEQAHRAHVLLSTDALRHFISSVPAGSDPKVVMATVLSGARERYPAEDGWVILSEARMQETCLACIAAPVPMVTTSRGAEQYVPTVVPSGTGSLAEMIASGNVAAAFALIEHRPMLALADAVADFDALYRLRRGGEVHVSDLLTETAAALTDDQIKAMIAALTSALDGTYTSEAEAVKTAIMKAVKIRG